MHKLTARRLFVLAILILSANSARAQFTELRSLPGDPEWGFTPWGALTVIPAGANTRDPDLLFGMTSRGGAQDLGTIFRMSGSDGEGVVLLSFIDDNILDASDNYGRSPFGSLVLGGTTLYGMANKGGASYGTVFRINTDGSGLDVLHRFGGFSTDGQDPVGSLRLIGSTLYGMTPETGIGAVDSSGTIFKINTDGTGYTQLHQFNFFDPDNGASPQGDLTFDGTALYGVTTTGGANRYSETSGMFMPGGAIFTINLDGSGFRLLHSFPADDPNDGRAPEGTLLLLGTTLYGMTFFRGAGSKPWPAECYDNPDAPDYCYSPTAPARPGIIYRINTNGSGYEILRTFELGPTGQGYPVGSLSSDGQLLYGMTSGNFDPAGPPELWTGGTVFQMKPDGSCYRTLHTFPVGKGAGGRQSRLSVVSRRGSDEGVTLYGMTVAGGRNIGSVFRIDNVNEPLLANAGSDQTVEATSSAGASVSLSGSASGAGGTYRYRWSAPGVVFDDGDAATPSGVFPVGQTVATLTVDDGTSCFTATDQVLVTVQDTTPPVVSCSASPSSIWSPNRIMIPIRLAVCATDATTAPAQMRLGTGTASSSEPDNAIGLGDGDTIGDTDGRDGFIAPVNIAGKLSFQASTGCFEGTIGLRAERAGTKRDRIYTIVAGVKDSSDREGRGSCRVVVPHN